MDDLFGPSGNTPAPFAVEPSGLVPRQFQKGIEWRAEHEERFVLLVRDRVREFPHLAADPVWLARVRQDAMWEVERPAVDLVVAGEVKAGQYLADEEKSAFVARLREQYGPDFARSVVSGLKDSTLKKRYLELVR